jgi:2-polyprenyl-3-methyl-5-hydroxy-6-metoxy-1,4-benzoquinol methylase
MSTDLKAAGYYGENRADLVALLPRPIGRALDIGCGEGAVGRELLAQGATSVHGVEIFPDAAAVAAEAYDGVAVAPVEVALTDDDQLPGEFDTILCYDVLEHLADPSLILSLLRQRAVSGAHLHVSVPNARHLGLVRDLLLRGTFGYTEFGHRDTTHLRWFTRRDIETAVRDAGWRILTSRPNPFRGRDEPFNRATGGKLQEFIALQWNVLAVCD